jgi:hypothetical protein
VVNNGRNKIFPDSYFNKAKYQSNIFGFTFIHQNGKRSRIVLAVVVRPMEDAVAKRSSVSARMGFSLENVQQYRNQKGEPMSDELTDEKMAIAEKLLDGLCGPKCDACKWKELEACPICNNPSGQFYSCFNERRDGKCGPEGKLFKPREAGEWE